MPEEVKVSRKPERIATLTSPPDKVNQIDVDYIMEYCKANKQVAWLKQTASQKYTSKDGKERQYGLFQIRKEFVEKFMPELREASGKKETMLDRIMAL